MATLSEVIAYVETKNDPHAMRFEEKVYERYRLFIDRPKAPEGAILENIRSAHAFKNNLRCSWHTAAMVAATSWGKHQVMGFNLYADHIMCPLQATAFLFDDVEQDVVFLALARHMGIADWTPEDLIADPNKLEVVAKKWNGTGNVPAYSKLITDAIGALT